ncbi:MAG: LysM domain-containing protein [Methylovulum sp.]|nr:LysM domain-containing protein [Methylovulum sp.]
MAFRKLSGLLLTAFISMTVCADELQINPDYPEHYTVVRGDTLWDISGKFLHHPSYWPQLWSYNSQIRNPDLIYPGDTIHFAMVDGRPQISLTRGENFVDSSQPAGDLNIQSTCVLHEDDAKRGRASFPVDADGKVTPCIRESDLNQAIKLIPNSKISQYLTRLRVVGAGELGAAPYVVDVAGEHLVAGGGDKVYVRSILNTHNSTYTIYRPGQVYKNPDTGDILGYEAQYIADAILKKVGDPATLTVPKSASEVRFGDRLLPNLEADVVLNYFPRPPKTKIVATILSVVDGVNQVGLYNTVSLDKGSKDGLQVGHELDIYKRGALVVDKLSPVKNELVKLPDEEAGMLMVYRTFDRVSYALVMRATLPIHVSDKAQTP